ncbi:hypothetical protein C0R09_02825 [Brevibacillus laterosporus]|uniref:hypothetical protein n=1 Tax=Brevibacillus laterosporus TaxID=1465 RepID=UPI000C783F02|nr:hypothetical protein [Brevibacillus laterosporus]AUM63547.1 hypothetical protein C0R09_02825 [Brevibacillus laterosporus]
MKKFAMLFSVGAMTILSLTPITNSSVLAKNKEKELKIIEISLNEKSSEPLKFLSSDKNNYYFIHNEGKEIDTEEIEEYTKAELKIDRSTTDKGIAPTLIGVGVYESDSSIRVDYIFDQVEEVPLDEIRTHIKDKVEETENQNSISSDEDTRSESYTYRIRDERRDELAGVYTSNVDYTKKGTSTLDKKKVSVWDVKYFNQSEPRNDYQTRQLSMRYKHTGLADDTQTIRSYGPYTTDTESSASVGLSGLVPSVSWTFNTKSANITDQSSLSDNYAKWNVDIALGTNTSKNNFVWEPGVRVTNSKGRILFQHNHYVYYYRNLDSAVPFNTGTIKETFKDL